MKRLEFKMKLEGPAGSGKSTFIQLILNLCYENTEWAAHRGEDGEEAHTLIISSLRPKIPKERK